MFAGEEKEHILVEISHSRRSRVTKFAAGKREEIVRGKNLHNQSLFPINMALPGLGLKLVASLDKVNESFNLDVNGTNFCDLNYAH